ncbi:MAG: aldo/keto reductase [Gammaproteobacteria bacterium]|nr:aldo/keto reductase [Gammaproteobacteria bacterium]
MERRPLGRTGMAVSVLGLGTVKLGRDQQVKYPRPFTLPDDAAATRLLEVARELGINLLDTAPAYGTSEARLGRLLHGQRDDWVLCSKVGEEFVDGRSFFDFSPEHTRRSVERSLRRLATDRLDVVLIHSDGDDLAVLDHSGALETLMALRDAGHVRAVGMSHKTLAGGRRALELGCDVIMATLNLDYRDELPLIAEAGSAGCGVLIKKALASGHAGTASLQFAAAQPGVASLVVGTIDETHLRANAAAVSGDR